MILLMGPPLSPVLMISCLLFWCGRFLRIVLVKKILLFHDGVTIFICLPLDGSVIVLIGISLSLGGDTSY